MANFYDVIANRHSVRAYSDQPVEEDRLERVLEAARRAPTACNLQPYRLLVIHKGATHRAVCECYNAPFLAQAPVIVVVLGNRDKAWKRLDGSSIHPVDSAIVMEHVVLAATAEGLGTCWVCAFDQAALHTKLKLDAEWDPVALTPLGYAAETPKGTPRKPVDEIVHVIHD